MKTPAQKVAGLILAAGQSKRMGRPKMTMTWGDTTIIGHVTQTLLRGGANPVVVVTGGARKEVEDALRGLPISTVFNSEYVSGGMISSVNTGLKSLPGGTTAVLITLGDQPQIEVVVVEMLIKEFCNSGAALIVPSYRMRRGHPWLVKRELWQEILALQPQQTLRDFLEQKASQILYVPVETASVVQDIDSPDQYAKYRPK